MRGDRPTTTPTGHTEADTGGQDDGRDHTAANSTATTPSLQFTGFFKERFGVRVAQLRLMVG